ncbi:MAG: class I SAM-dependent methyltransferase [Arenicellales bacterium]|nr:class I SAM-dependent methyltransferase [Arenicellales bacterium]
MELENEIMNAYTVVFDGLVHLGPSDSATTRNLVERLRPDLPSASRVADFGCGVGASALVLAQSLPEARVLALDSHAPFIARLETAANKRGLGERISAVVGDMADPPPLDGVMGMFDLIWSESAIYSIGRANAFTCWRPLLKPDGWLVFSDIVWQRKPAARSVKASSFWAREYPDIKTAADVVDELTAAGFSTLDPVLSPRKAWSNYYEPLRDRLHLLSKLENRSPALINVIADLEREIHIYDCAGDDVALFFFLAQRDSVPK